jgi:pimeloyl-ACP methyl ester carboxylesterase
MREHFTSIGGYRTRYFEGGEGDPVVLLHGGSLAVDSLCWAPIFEDLCTSFRVIAFDQVGFGETESPQGGEYPSRLQRVDHAVAFMEGLGLRNAALVGHSEGAFIAVRVAAERPELAARLVVVASGSVAPRLGGTLDDGWMAACRLAYDYQQLTGSEDDLIAMYDVLSRRRHPALEKSIRENYRRAAANGQLDAIRAASSSETDYEDYMRVQERWIQPFLPTLTLPTLLLWAADDATVPVERGLRLMESMPNSDLCVLREAAHMVMWDRSEAVGGVLKGWLHQKPPVG